MRQIPRRHLLLYAMSLARCITRASAFRPALQSNALRRISLSPQSRVIYVSGDSIHQIGIVASSNGSRQYFKRSNIIHLATQNGDDGEDNYDDDEEELTMENLYTEWSLEHDKLLWEHRDSSAVDQAILLGRGLQGVKARLAKLRDVNSPAYERLFAQGNNKVDGGNDDCDSAEKTKLVPVQEVLRRIQWDYSLSSADFSILHYDRVDDTVVESPMDAPNASIKGSSTSSSPCWM